MTKLEAQVARQIDEAFASAEYPGDGNIAYDQSGRHIECSQIASSFHRKKWQDISADFVRENADALFFFSPAAYAYFLPAFMKASLRDFEHADMVPINVVVSLSPSLSQLTLEQFNLRIVHLTVSQRKGVSAFLRYLSTERAVYFPLNHPQTALDEFWSRYESE